MKTDATAQPNTVSPPVVQMANVATETSGLATPLRNTVLVVDDEPAALRVAVRGLTHFGFAVLTAADGPTAVALFQQHQSEIRCVLCDVTMPGRDGWAVLTALRQISPGVPVILASGYETSQIRENDQTEQPQDFLQKPFRFQTLHEAILKIPPPSPPLPAAGDEGGMVSPAGNTSRPDP